MENREAQVKVYGADWCSFTIKTRQHLDQLGIPYQYINVDENQEASQWVKDQNDGLETKPTLDIEGEILTNPDAATLDEILQKHGISS